MAHKTLTDLFIKNAKTDQPQADIFDALTPGLAIRITKAGKKTWTFTYTSPRDQKRARISLGAYPALGLEAARKVAVQRREMVEAGADPRDAIQAPAAAITAEKTIGELIEDRLRMEVRPHLRSAKPLEDRYNKYVIPVVGAVPVKAFQIDPHLNLVVDPLLAKGKRRAAELLFSEMKTLFKFAVRRGAVPFSAIAAAALPKAERVIRERFLSLDEIVSVWAGLPNAMGEGATTPLILKLCLLTGQRLSEVSGMTRSEIDQQTRLWTIPKQRVKNKHDHVVPLSDMAWEIVSDRLRNTNGEYLFPEGGGPVRHTTVAQNLARMIAKLGTAKWRCHDLRRTVATHMSVQLTIPDLIIGHVLNHRGTTKSSITSQVYNRNTYLPEKKEALDKWAAFLTQLVGANVVEIGRAA